MDQPGLVEHQDPVEACEQLEVMGDQDDLLGEVGDQVGRPSRALRRSSSVVGSSMTSRSGSVTRIDARASSCFWPPERR